MTIIASADGSALGNPGPAGWAWYIDPTSWQAGGWAHGTNNQGELTAVLNLLEETRHRREEPLRVLCDSQYVINSVTKWMPGWKKKGWKKRDGKPVLNVDIMKALDRELAGRDVSFEWVKGHAGHELNEAADERARAMAVAYQKGTDPARMPVGPGFRDDDAASDLATSEKAADAADVAGAADAGASAGAGRHSTAADATPSASEAAPVTSHTVAGARPTTTAAGARPATTVSDPDEQPDLFSELALGEDPADPTDPADPSSVPGGEAAGSHGGLPAHLVADAVSREMAVLRSTAQQHGAVDFLHRDALCVDTHGRCLTGEAVLEVLRGSGAVDETRVTSLGSGSYHLSYRSEEPSAVTRRSSVWVREDQHNEMGPWLLRYHQVTAEH
ncbi:ribonuclease H [Glutamicibacter protophormiae]|uniref:Ribonuclease H n=1 Tax=Kocuria varians TaxID=1272 RepID=A0A7D7L228_KOCVA|nr:MULTISPECIES: ribonuclease H [Kocuria]WNB87879.1 ribonuclease H [Glutamicibacter protophormiae]MDN5632248.1 ribonuclease HI [Kocuria sp.]QMS56548.1 Ribonuclease HI [Kocuria varians]RUP81493.1 ribonuclease HI [Kocuria sp. HSID17590]RUQ11152.1 ribonuclease HI [Kocuria sp. HSID17582]